MPLARHYPAPVEAPRWPTADRPWISQRWPNPYAGVNRPAAWEAWFLLCLALVGVVLALLLPFPWRLASIPPAGLGAGLLIVGAAKQHQAQRR